MKEKKEVLQPKNQMSEYHSAGDLYQKIMNEDISIERAVVAVSALNAQSKIFANECKLAEIRNAPDIRHLELFDPEDDFNSINHNKVS